MGLVAAGFDPWEQGRRQPAFGGYREGMMIHPWKKWGLEGKPDVFKALQRVSCQVKVGGV